MAATVAPTSTSVTDLALAAKAAARRLAAVDSATKDAALLAIADALEARLPGDPRGQRARSGRRARVRAVRAR